MKKKLLTLVLAIGLANPVLAATTTFGDSDCGEWINPASDYAMLAHRAWLMGFLSGLNGEESLKNPLGKISSGKQIFLWMDKYCKDNPLEKLSYGGLQLMLELMLKK